MSRQDWDARRDLGDPGEEAGAVMESPTRVSAVASGLSPGWGRGTMRVSSQGSEIVVPYLGVPGGNERSLELSWQRVGAFWKHESKN